jgi:hypothetical protein
MEKADRIFLYEISAVLGTARITDENEGVEIFPPSLRQEQL